MKWHRIFSAGQLILCTAVLTLPAGELQAEEFFSRGKRDPFLKLSRAPASRAPVEIIQPPPLEKRPPGLAGLLVSEVTVAGLASNHKRHLIVLKGADDFTYIAGEGSKLYDGYLKEIQKDRVVFIREVVDTRGTERILKVVKRIYTEEH